MRNIRQFESAKNDADVAELRLLLMAFQTGWERGTSEFRQLWGARFVPDGSPEFVAWFNELGRVSSDGATMTAAMTAVGAIDVTAMAREIKVPTIDRPRSRRQGGCI